MKNNTKSNDIQSRRPNLLTLTVIAIVIFVFNAHGQLPGNLDPTFNGNGRRITNIGSQNEFAWSAASQPDGKNIAVGFSDSKLILIRYESNGQLDETFGTGGIAAHSTGAQGLEIALQPDGKILIGGTIPSGALFDGDFAVLRFNSNGTIDPTFGVNGTAQTGFGYKEETPTGMLLQSDGKIVLAGQCREPGELDYNICIARFDSGGTLDSTFDGDGKVMTDVFGENAVDIIEGVAIQPDGKLVVAGGRNTGSTFRNAMIVRYNTDGSLDTSFDGEGVLLYDFITGNNDWATDVAVQPDGKIIISTNTAPDAFNSYLALARFNSDGTLDNSFDGDGIRTTTYSSRAVRILLQPGGHIVAVGGALNNGFSLFRFKPTGTSDTSFGNGGARQSVRFGTISTAWGMTIQPDGKIVVVGSDLTGSNTNFFAARFTALEPTAAPVSVSGRVLSSSGRGVSGATVYLLDQEGNSRQTAANPFGYYRFEGVQVSKTYVINVFSKRYSFGQQVVSVNEEIVDLNFIIGNGGKEMNYEKQTRRGAN